MKKTQGKDAYRNIKKRIVSYLSICLVIMLGLGGVFITRYMGAGINERATEYYNDHGFKSYEFISSLGVSDEDIAQIMETDCVTDAEGVIRTTASFAKDDYSGSVDLCSMTERISVPEVVEGRAPAAQDECMIGEDFAMEKGFKVGDRVRIAMSGGTKPTDSAGAENDENGAAGEAGEAEKEGALLENEFTVTGLMKHPDYMRRKSTDTVVLPRAAFNKEYLGDFQYSHVFIKTEDPEGVDIFSDKYFRETADTKLALEELAGTLEVDSLARIKKTLNDRLDKEWQAALDEFEDAQNEIDENEYNLNAELDKALADLNDAQDELDRKVNAANKEIKENEKKIKDAEETISASEKKIKESEKKIKAGEKEIKSGEKEIKSGEKELKEAKKKLKQIDENLPEAKKYLEEMKEQYEGQLEDKLRELTYARKLLKKLDGLDADSEEFQKAVKDLAEFIFMHQADLEKIQDFCKKDEVMEAAEKLRDITGVDGTEAVRQIRKADIHEICTTAYNIYDHGGDIGSFVEDTEKLIKSIEDNLKTIEEYENYIKEYEDNRSSLYKKLGDKEKELAAAKKELAAAKKKLAAAKKKLAAAKEQLAAAKEKVAAAKKELAAAKEQLAAEKRKAQAQIRDGWNLYYAQKEDFEQRLAEAKALLAENREEAEARIADLRADIDALECKWLVLDRRANAGYVDVKSNIGAINSASLIFGVLFMLITAIVCFSTLSIIIEEQKKMVGTVKAFGFHKGEILGKYLVFGVSASVIGCIAGILLGYVLSGVVLKAFHNAAMYPFAQARSIVTPGATIIACALMILVCAVSTVIACSDILKSPASILMKGGTAKKTGYRKKKKTSSRRGGSLYSRLIIRNMMDDKVRVAISIIIIAFSTMLIGLGISMKLAFDGMAEKQVSDIYRYDVRVDLGDTDDPEIQEAVEKAMEENGAEYLPASYETHVFRLGDRLDALYVISGDPEKLGDYFAVSDIKTGEALALPDDGVLVQRKMKESYGFAEGSTLSVFSSELDECSADVKGVFQNYVGRVIIASPEGYKTIFGESPDMNCYYVRLGEGDLEKLESDVLAANEDASFEVASEFAKKFASASLLYNLIVYVTTGIAILMSFMILSNLANIFLNRKKTELTVMRINGFSIKQTKGYLSRETIVTTAAGVLLGVLTGAILTPVVIKAMEQPDLQFVRSFHIQAWVIAVVLEVIFSIVINSLVFRKVKDLNFRDVA